MALCWIDGFDAYGAATTEVCDSGRLGMRYPRISYEGTYNNAHVVVGRQLGNALQLSQYLSYCETPPCTTGDTVIIGIAAKRGHTDQFHICRLRNAENSSFYLRSPNGGTELEAYRGATLLGTTSGANIDVGVWRYIELKVRWGINAGTFEVKVDGTTLLAETGQQTGEIGESYYDRVALLSGFRHGMPSEPNPQFDDFYICDTSGSVNTDFLGDRKVVTLFPASDESVNFETVLPAGDHYEAVNDQALDDSSYVESSVVDTKDIYALDALPPNLGDPNGIQVVTTSRSTGHTFYDLVPTIKTNGSEFDRDSIRTNSQYQGYNYLVEINPSTELPWTLSDLDNLQAGLKVG